MSMDGADHGSKSKNELTLDKLIEMTQDKKIFPHILEIRGIENGIVKEIKEEFGRIAKLPEREREAAFEESYQENTKVFDTFTNEFDEREQRIERNIMPKIDPTKIKTEGERAQFLTNEQVAQMQEKAEAGKREKRENFHKLAPQEQEKEYLKLMEGAGIKPKDLKKAQKKVKIGKLKGEKAGKGKGTTPDIFGI